MVKPTVVILLMACITGFAIGENPSSGLTGNSMRGIANIGTSHNQVNQPVWSQLSRMDLNARANSNIDINIGAPLNQTAENLAAEISSLWNSGRHEQALGMFPELQAVIGDTKIAIGISWNDPVKTESGNQAALWERDIQVNYQDSVYGTTLCAHQATGNLFSVILVQDGPFQLFSVNFSTDNGLTWAETYYLISSDIMLSVGSAILGNRCYIAYPFYNSVRLKCFDITDGHRTDFVDSTSTVRICSIGDSETLKEISLISNQNLYNNRLYCNAISTNGRLIYCWADGDAIAWNEIPTGIGNADRGLDACFNEQFGSYYLYISYIDRSDRLNVFGRQNQTGPEQDEAGLLGR